MSNGESRIEPTLGEMCMPPCKTPKTEEKDLEDWQYQNLCNLKRLSMLVGRLENDLTLQEDKSAVLELNRLVEQLTLSYGM